MKTQIVLGLLIFLGLTALGQTETDDYVEFDDRKNVVHGVYFGFSGQYGQVEGKGTAFGTMKLAYVANQQLEIGFAATGFFNDRPNNRPDLFDGDKVALVGGYAGFHVEPILFGKRFISVSFPLLVGGGIATFTGVDTLENDEDLDSDDFDDFFIVEPGVNVLYNLTRYTQLETGVRYRFTSSYDLSPFNEDNLNGFSLVFGLKVGIFNMGRKKPVKDRF
ncbi:hypothetical protein POV27_01345 [Aureisphaera galaxeae]|uniref:hypothetical protein n=1 Tax=Aureisphaera galaxeae TaxID=1538023 RepID=UPI00234FF53B|nr:hypothetical protein [Aureisphaera galaxeae]MDC8002683.1 hypothetical protein [Aureisphaera galaxeae]